MKEIWLRILRHKRVLVLSLCLFLISGYYILASDNAILHLIDGQFLGKERLVTSWVITINGEPVFYLDSQEEANQALEMVKRRYLPTDYTQLTVEGVSFQEDVQVFSTKSYPKQLSTPEGVAEMSLLTVVATIQTTVEEQIPYTTEYQNDASIRKGQQQIKQEGTDGSRQVTYRSTTLNGVETARDTLAENIVLEPLSRIVVRGTQTTVASRGGGGSGQLAWPLRGPITSPFGYRGQEFHQAIDIDGVTGNPVKAAGDGVVIFTGWDGNYGKSGKVGSTGRSTGSHLDFEVRVNDSPRNPLSYLK